MRREVLLHVIHMNTANERDINIDARIRRERLQDETGGTFKGLIRFYSDSQTCGPAA